jgi:antitoxin component of MazEF toxin-antitoxin module
MIKTITRVGNSQGIIFDNAIMELARLKVGDEVNVEIHPNSGAITIMPSKVAVIGPEKAGAAAKRLIGRNSELFRRLS